MMDIQPIVAFLRRTYLCPEVDPAWVRDCVQALTDAGRQVSIDEVHTQFLYSDLSQSTLLSRSFPPVQTELHEIVLFPRPTILQIHHVSEIGHSAFQIQHTMEQRSEVLSGQTLIRRMDDEEENENEVDIGKVPPYPRSMLKLELSDGRRTVKAMEYRRINGLVLGQTSLGCKLVCQNVKCLRDTLLLTPENTQVIESSVEHLEAIQKEQFLSDLKRRMGKLDNDPNGSIPKRKVKPPPAVRPKPSASASASSSRPANLNPPKISQPKPRVQSPDIIPAAGPSRSRYFPPPPAARSNDVPLFDPPSSPQLVKPIPIRAKGVKRRQSIEEIETSTNAPTPQARRSRAAAKAAATKVHQLYHDIPNGKFTESDDYDDQDEDEFDYDVDVDESFIRQIDEVTAKASASGSGSGFRDSKNNDVYDFDEEEEDEEDFMILDESMIRQIDKVTNSHQNAVKGKGKASPVGRGKQMKRNGKYHDPDEDDNEVTFDDDSFHVDESFLKHLDEMEYDRQRKLSSQNTNPNKSSQSNTSKRLRPDGGSRSKRRRSTSPLEDSLKENVQPEIIEISD
ncbi:hypothetical protein I204_03217 [Kwoniella mangroviensis CBS 8886]|uniref:uncharacterized protein n=1 Tax=Kwoniella mangroviensis CBS 8507 TaxID=1296122 RepID=UPI00080CFD47|nr:uncharacterized protein I203_00274 [Kwoniella mangroviensis CBS 8507]OCF70142.1 hypothetical protein I203_00274 [Kwoniella mangroviensis CBS 8507]OCF75920.1 hypothetical protein I204_03217 [Kwoniella mangroviensis CBS 8886]